MILPGFAFSLTATAFSVFLLGWQFAAKANADWIAGFLAVFWSLVMMLRLMTLTAESKKVSSCPSLAQKIISMMHIYDEKKRRTLLTVSLGNSYLLFVGTAFIFAAWLAFCAAFPSNGADLLDVKRQMAWLADPLWSTGMMFDWGRSFLLIFALCMMGFVLRSYADQKSLVRPALIVLTGYAVSGFIAFAGLDAPVDTITLPATFVGNGAGALAWLAGSLDEKSLNLFEILLLENGVGGLALLTCLLFVPFGSIARATQRTGADRVVSFCGAALAIVLLLTVFLPVTPLLAGFLALCWTGLCLAWGASDYAHAEIA